MSSQAPSSRQFPPVTDPPYKMRRLSETSAKKGEKYLVSYLGNYFVSIVVAYLRSVRSCNFCSKTLT